MLELILCVAPVVQFKDCFSRSSYIRGDPETSMLTLILLPNEQMSLFPDNNFCQNSDGLATVANLDFLVAGAAINIPETYMVGTYVYKFNKELEISFSLAGTSVAYNAIDKSSQASYSVAFDNAYIYGGITRISHTKFNASSCWESVNFSYTQNGEFEILAQPNECRLASSVKVNLIARCNGSDVVFEMDDIAGGFDFQTTSIYRPESTLYANTTYKAMFKEFLSTNRELQMQFELTFTNVVSNISSYVKEEINYKKPQGSPPQDYLLSLYVQTKQLKYVFEKNPTDPFKQLMTAKYASGVTKFNCTFSNTLDGKLMQDTVTFTIENVLKMGYFEIMSTSSKYLPFILKSQDILIKSYITFLTDSGGVESEHITLKNMVRSAINYETFYWLSNDKFYVRLKTYRNFGFYDITEQTYSFEVYYDDQIYADFRLPTRPFQYLAEHYEIMYFSCKEDALVSPDKCEKRMKEARKIVFKDVSKFTLIAEAENEFNLTRNPYSEINTELLLIFMAAVLICLVVVLVLFGMLVWWEKKR